MGEKVGFKATNHIPGQGDVNGELLGYIVDCSIVLEEKIAELYEHVSRSLPPMLGGILLHVARESRNHAEFFIFLKNLVGVESGGCSGNKIISFIDELLEKVKDGSRSLTVSMAKGILSECVDLERAVGEEYGVRVLSQLIRANLKAFSRNIKVLEELKTILEEISLEESFHSSLVRLVLENME